MRFLWSGVRALKALDGDEASSDQIMELMTAVDDYVPEPDRDTEKPFLMSIEDVFSYYWAGDGGDWSGGAGDFEGE